jgi:hypothetical protein
MTSEIGVDKMEDEEEKKMADEEEINFGLRTKKTFNIVKTFMSTETT